MADPSLEAATTASGKLRTSQLASHGDEPVLRARRRPEHFSATGR